VTDFLFVIDIEGSIVDINEVVKSKLGYSEFELKGMSLSKIGKVLDLKGLSKATSLNDKRFETELIGNDNQVFIVSTTVTSVISKVDGELEGYLVIAEDITEKKNKEKLIFQKITETQESERKRVADDLHDSLGQELSSIKMMIGAIVSKMPEKDKLTELLQTCSETVDESISNIRKICFDLIPSALAKAGFITAVQQLSDKFRKENVIDLLVNTNVEYLELRKDQEITLYRVLQEFINNTLKHAKSPCVIVDIDKGDHGIKMSFRDKGKGFDMNKVDKDKLNIGRGLDTMVTRIKLFDGNAELTSEIGKGTALNIVFS